MHANLVWPLKLHSLAGPLPSLAQVGPPLPSSYTSPKSRGNLSLSLHIHLSSNPIDLPLPCVTHWPTSLPVCQHLTVSFMVHHSHLLSYLFQQIFLPSSKSDYHSTIIFNVSQKGKSHLSSCNNLHQLSISPVQGQGVWRQGKNRIQFSLDFLENLD